MTPLPLVLLVVLVTAVGLVVLARRINVPYPILLLVGGVGLGFLPGMPSVNVAPDVVLLVLLPPLLYSAAFFAPLRQMRANIRPIGLLAVVVVALTTVVVAVVAHFALGLSWAVAFVLGAIVSPTDPTAVEAIARRLAVPRRLVSILEGESLINDGMALTIYASAVTAAVVGSVSVAEVAGSFVLSVVGGVVIGLGLGWLIERVRARIDSPPEELAVSMLSAYAAYLPAELVGASGILASVTVGAYLGWRQHEFISASTRIQTFAFWPMFVFLLNAGLFIVVGLQLPSILEGLSGRSAVELLADAALISAVVIVVRVLWVGGATVLLRLAKRGPGGANPLPSPYAVVVAFTGMRGAVSLAAALAIPLQTQSGAPFPERDLLIFLAFAVIAATLIPQGLGLPRLLHRLGLDHDEAVEREEADARLEAARAGNRRLEELRDEPWVRQETADRLAHLYTFRENRFSARLDGHDGDGVEERSSDFQRLRRELIAAERDTLVRLRDENRIDSDVLRTVERDLDLEDNRLA